MEHLVEWFVEMAFLNSLPISVLAIDGFFENNLKLFVEMAVLNSLKII